MAWGSVGFWRCLVGFAVLAAPMKFADADEISEKAEPTVDKLHEAQAALERGLAPYMSRFDSEGFGHWVYEDETARHIHHWSNAHIARPEVQKRLLAPLKTVIRYATCDGHPEAMQTLYRLRQTITLRFLSMEHRLVLEWRALHLGLDLRFFEPIRWRTSLPRATSEKLIPLNASHRTENESTSDTANGDEFAPPPTPHQQALLIRLTDQLRKGQYEKAMSHIPDLVELCPNVQTGPVKRLRLYPTRGNDDSPTRFIHDPIDPGRPAG